MKIDWVSWGIVLVLYFVVFFVLKFVASHLFPPAVPNDLLTIGALIGSAFATWWLYNKLA